MIARGTPSDAATAPATDLTEILHELQVHQVELELQNEELREAQIELQSSRDAYASLYDFAPVGYVTLDRNQRLLNVNFIACKMLGEDRARLIKTHLSRFIAREDADSFFLCLKNAAANGFLSTCEAKMSRLDGAVFDAELITEVLKGPEGAPAGYRVAILDITERKKTDNDLRRYRDHLEQEVSSRTAELRTLAQRLVEIQEKERARIGAELHDDIGQTLTYVTLLLAQAIRRPNEKLLQDALLGVKEAMGKTRELSHTLSPGILMSAGLPMALECLVGEFERSSGIKCEVTVAPELRSIPKEVALAAYRITQEALTNVVCHAAASELNVKATQKGTRLSIVITDDGIGFDSAVKTHTTGLVGMRERALALGGEFKIDSNLGTGTRITVELPVPASESPCPSSMGEG
ncbi:PAS domain-containing sensor histidine kinase [Dehalogenimonas etheniformans]|uniref:PAS domain-containing sensor histidine kinase n=1 Tax=Dehalogenimonas etheniformans TaxID=1536648 RepID=UPI000CB9A04B|nr:PAS domain S-box protein [Dehalogenimonas etheniformans]QNT75458.1 PAS domain S-box protein [Dehalogenimonas etheniformans]